ncbi:hypothetical protein Q7I20_01985 [Aeromonas veronii]|uniref:hypothetical protein n=1 Tax=Aeromonas veronii TaxID=654 RepID=UPI003003DDD1
MNYSEIDIKEFINETVPAYNKASVVEALKKSPDELEQLGMQLTGESGNRSFIVKTGANTTSNNSLWQCIKSEVYDYFCTKSAKYRAERNKAEINIKNILTIIATAIASQFNLAIGVVAGAVTVAIISVFKIGKNAWCELSKASNT